jgi:hypothetical protein
MKPDTGREACATLTEVNLARYRGVPASEYYRRRMKLRTIALAVALACGVTGIAEAKTKNHARTKYKAKKFKKHKFKYNAKSR